MIYILSSTSWSKLFFESIKILYVLNLFKVITGENTFLFTHYTPLWKLNLNFTFETLIFIYSENF